MGGPGHTKRAHLRPQPKAVQACVGRYARRTCPPRVTRRTGGGGRGWRGRGGRLLGFGRQLPYPTNRWLGGPLGGGVTGGGGSRRGYCLVGGGGSGTSEQLGMRPGCDLVSR